MIQGRRTEATSDLRDYIAAGRKFRAFYADPAWEFRAYSPLGMSRSPERHYPTMTTEQICALPVEALAEDDAILFLWAVYHRLPDALMVCNAWGFDYKTVAFTWVKTYRDKLRTYFMGLGYWTRANPEICLLATRGSPKRINKDVPNLIVSQRCRHSEKPEEIAHRIERLVDGPYLEMFARRPRDGWSVWGNDVEANLFHPDGAAI